MMSVMSVLHCAQQKSTLMKLCVCERPHVSESELVEQKRMIHFVLQSVRLRAPQREYDENNRLTESVGLVLGSCVNLLCYKIVNDLGLCR
jgi:hypothetical protein